MKAVVFACRAMGVLGIRRLIEAGFKIPLVFTREDLRDEDSGSPSVEAFCTEFPVACVGPRDPNQFGWIERIREAGPDMLFSFAYPPVLKAPVLALPKHGSFRIHPALLPDYRGPDPVRRAIMAGERTTGTTLHELVVKPYAGAVAAWRTVEISPDDTAGSLSHKIDRAADAMLAEVLPRMRDLEFTLTPQDLTAGSSHDEVMPEEGRIFWDRTAGEIRDLVRAMTSPFSGAFGILGEDMVFFRQAAFLPDVSLEPGSLGFQGENVLIGTAHGCVRPEEIEANGRVLKGPGLVLFFREHEGDTFQ